MIIKKNLSLKSVLEFTGHHLYWLTAWMLLVTSIYYFTQWKFIAIPWLPLSLIGTAVAFYVGFKNNQSYSRLWEARKIWGGLVNDSRKFASMISTFRTENTDGDKGNDLRRQMIFRHIAYLYQLREQLLEPTPWEHISQSGRIGKFNRIRRANNLGAYEKELAEIATKSYLTSAEKEDLQNVSNKATQLLNLQTNALQELTLNNSINSFQQIKIQDIINNFFDEQGKAERIKRFPFPRKYASFSFIFVGIFIFLLPFGIIGEFSKMGSEYVWLSIPLGVIIGWVYLVMEMNGDYSENPFQGLHNDVPMLNITRNIEIDMLQMIGDNNVPQPIPAKDVFVM